PSRRSGSPSTSATTSPTTRRSASGSAGHHGWACARASPARSTTTASTGASTGDRRSRPREAGRPVSVPVVGLSRQAAAIAGELEDGFADVLRRARFVGGPAVERFEEAWASYCGAAHAVGVNSGTDAIALALRAHGVGPGDEVITAANTCVATITAIVAIEATPVLADVDPETWTLDSDSAEAAITPRTRALVPVHLYGQCADLEPLGALASEHGLVVVEDASQAHGAEYHGSRCGSLTTATYSFYPTKNLGALGDAGAVVTNEPAIADELRRLRSHGERAEA